MSEEDYYISVEILLSDSETGEMFPFTLSISQFWGWYDTITRWGLEQALEMAAYSATLVKHELVEKGPHGAITVTGQLPDQDHAYLRKMLEALKAYGDRFSNRNEYVLALSYDLLSRREWTRDQALRFAQNMLDPTISADAWRRRVDRWAGREGKPAIGLTKGRPRKT
jgi:hypothetical protein